MVSVQGYFKHFDLKQGYVTQYMTQVIVKLRTRDATIFYSARFCPQFPVKQNLYIVDIGTKIDCVRRTPLNIKLLFRAATNDYFNH